MSIAEVVRRWFKPACKHDMVIRKPQDGLYCTECEKQLSEMYVAQNYRMILKPDEQGNYIFYRTRP